MTTTNDLSTAYQQALKEFTGPTEAEQLRAELAKVREQLTAANRRADGLEADLRSAVKGNDAWANQTAAKDPESQYLIWSHHHKAWWAPNSRGYRSNVNDAGLFTFAAAQQELHRGCYCCQVPEVPVLAELTVGAGDQKLRSVIAAATRAAIEYGQVNRCYEQPAEATR